MKLLRARTRNAWRKWLENHFRNDSEIWLVFPKASTGRKRISYNDAVEEALCFGWIDSIQKRISATESAQRFTPRRPKSTYSQPNRERLAYLKAKGKIHPSVLPQVEQVLGEPFVFPKDILAAIRKNPTAWAYYQKFSPAYRRIRVSYIDGARKRPEEFTRRLEHFIRLCEQNKMIGYGGIEKFY